MSPENGVMNVETGGPSKPQAEDVLVDVRGLKMYFPVTEGVIMTRGRLAASRFTHQAEGFPPLDIKADAIDGFDLGDDAGHDDSLGDREIHLQAPDETDPKVK